jgi:DNA-directed RNA polymerase specialized sigma24 family protein
LEITQEAFDALLRWLDPDRDEAGRKYETIRASLVRMFVAKGLAEAEDLADEAISRVSKRLPEIRATYVGNPASYFHGVARNLLLEAGRRKEIAADLSVAVSLGKSDWSDEYECLMRCLQFIASNKRELVLDYHVYEGHDKIEYHKIMAEELGISETALRCRAHRIRMELERCVIQCVQNLRKQNLSPQA